MNRLPRDWASLSSSFIVNGPLVAAMAISALSAA